MKNELQETNEELAQNDLESEGESEPKNENDLKKYDMEKEQEKDFNLKQAKLWVKNEQKPNTDAALTPSEKHYLIRYQRLLIKNNKLYFRSKDLTEIKRERLCIPRHMIPEIINISHSHVLSAHPGRKRTALSIGRHFHWPNMVDDVYLAVDGCEPCRAKNRTTRKNIPMKQTSTAISGRFKQFYVDIIGPWPSAQGYKHLLSFMDGYTKYPEAIPLKNITTDSVMEVLCRDLFTRYRVGFILTTDNGRQFTSKVFKAACDRLKVFTFTTIPYQPRGNAVERMHRTLEGAIRALMYREDAAPTQWVRYVNYGLAAIRQTPLSTLPYTPHYLTYLQDAVVPSQVLTGECPEELEGSPVKTAVEKTKTRYGLRAVKTA